ncbi:hypothetical protein Cgig2_017164 [Carnegiea gigantea]|uniref:Reverse transcriptase domain-containing protein n=1 Tax=Carnegiea gigantea TaxID=171969 RepID=A0A9Q1K4Q2_9CARY|nr:hypothetical protein Cgig2_017164 [Carnegiea gigantea]
MPGNPAKRPENCEFHDQNGHTTTECRELKKALNKLIDKGQTNRFLRRGSRFLRKECNHDVMALLPSPQKAGLMGHHRRRNVEGITWLVWRAQIRGTQQVLTTEQGNRITVPTMVFNGCKGLHLSAPHTDPLVVELKVANALIRRILIGTRSSVDIVTWDCLKRLNHPGREIVPLVHPIPGFGG